MERGSLKDFSWEEVHLKMLVGRGSWREVRGARFVERGSLKEVR